MKIKNPLFRIAASIATFGFTVTILSACAASESTPEAHVTSTVSMTATGVAKDEDSAWSLVVLGDSLVAEDYSILPELYAAHIEEDQGVEVEINNQGVGGQTCKNLLPNVKKYAYYRTPIQEADVILISLCGGDLLVVGDTYFRGDCGGTDGDECLREALAEFQANWDDFLTEITSLTTPADTLIRVIITGSFYDEFQDKVGTEKYETWANFQDEFYTYQMRTCEVYGISFLDLYHFDEPEGFRGLDNIHVTNEGKAIIAEMLRDLGYEHAQP